MKTKRTTPNKNTELALYQAISKIKNAGDAKKFFEDLCTPAEIQAMADRWLVVEPIKAGTPYRDIHDMTGVSVTTVGRVARSISMGTGGYNLIFDRIKGKKKCSNNKDLKLPFRKKAA